MSALLFIFLMHFMWFFGIHGSNVLDTVAKNLFENSMAININLVNNNQLPTEIFTKTFFDIGRMWLFTMFSNCNFS